MCLTIFGKKPNEVKSKIAKMDIVCYKVLEIRGKNLGRYIYFVTPYKEKKGLKEYKIKYLCKSLLIKNEF